MYVFLWWRHCRAHRFCHMYRFNFQHLNATSDRNIILSVQYSRGTDLLADIRPFQGINEIWSLLRGLIRITEPCYPRTWLIYRRIFTKKCVWIWMLVRCVNKTALYWYAVYFSYYSEHMILTYLNTVSHLKLFHFIEHGLFSVALAKKNMLPTKPVIFKQTKYFQMSKHVLTSVNQYINETSNVIRTDNARQLHSLIKLFVSAF